MTTTKSFSMKATAALAILLFALPALGRPSTFLDYAGDNSIVSQRGNPGQSVSGSYSWTSPEGTEFFVRYVADEFGYRVVESNALQRSAHGQLADGNQVYRSRKGYSEEARVVPQAPVQETAFSVADDSLEDNSLESVNEGYSVSSRGRVFEGRALIPTVSQSVDEQVLEAVEAAVEVAAQEEVPSARTEFIAPALRQEQASEMKDVGRTETEMMEAEAPEIVPQEQESASPAESETEIIPEGGRPLEDTEEEAIVPAPEPEAADANAVSDPKTEASSDQTPENEITAETEATPEQTEQPADVENLV